MEFSNLGKNRTLRFVKLLYIPVTFIFIFYFSWVNRQLLVELLTIADFNFIAIAVLLWTSLHLLAPLSPKIIFSSLGFTISYKNLLFIHVSRLPARYLPGGIWHTVGRLTDYHSYGVSKKQLTILIFIETFFPCFITLFIGGGYLYFSSEQNALSVIEGLLSGISLLILLLIPFMASWRLSSYWKKNFTHCYFSLIAVSIVFWFIASLSFLFYYSSVSFDMTNIPLIKIASTYIFSWGIGYISIFAPQGIGVLEVVAGKLMELPMALGGAIAFLAGFRLVALAADSLAWLTYRLFLLIHQNSTELPKIT